MRQIEPNRVGPHSKAFLLLVLLLLYPILAHLSIVYHLPVLRVSLLLVLLIALVALAVRKGRGFLYATLCLVALTAMVSLWNGRLVDLVYLPPIIVNVLLLIVFGRTLLPGKVPLVTRMATFLRGNIDADHARYTRRVTQAWAIFFATLVIECVVLAVVTPLEIWSLFANFVNYLLVFLFFVVEFHIRRICLPDLAHFGFVEFFRNLAKIDLRSIAS